MGRRRKARVLALQTLYECDFVGHDPTGVLQRLAQEERLPEEALAFAQELVEGVMERKKALDAIIERFAPAFPVERLAPIDRNILRLALFELLFHGKVPTKVAINEAVELAKNFGSQSSPRFVNGVLGSVSKAELSNAPREG